MKKRPGFTTTGTLLILLVIVIVGFVIYLIYTARHNSNLTESTVPEAPQVSSSNDLQTASSTLDQVDIDGISSDSNKLDTQLSGF